MDAVAHLGIKDAVPKTIMQSMSADDLTSENVASETEEETGGSGSKCCKSTVMEGL